MNLTPNDPIRSSPTLAPLLELAQLAVELGNRTNGAVGWTSESVGLARDFLRARPEEKARAFRLWVSQFDHATQQPKVQPAAGPSRGSTGGKY